MEEKDSGVVDVRVLCSSGETKVGKEEMILGATLGLMMMKFENDRSYGTALILQGFYLCRALCQIFLVRVRCMSLRSTEAFRRGVRRKTDSKCSNALCSVR